MSSFPRYIPWTPQLVCLLLNIVLTEGAHVAKKNEVLKKWNAVNEHFFNQNETQVWKTDLYKKDDPRKLRDKYKLVMSTCKAEIERGNLSGKSGDLDQQYELVKQIMMEIDDDEEEDVAEKAKKDATKKALNDIETKVQSSNRPNPLKKRDLDGNVVDLSDPTRKPKKDGFDELLIEFMKGKSGDASHSKSIPELSTATVTKGKLLNYIATNNISLEHLLEAADIYDADEDTVGKLQSIGMKVLVDIYCTREANFSSKHFKDELKDMGLESSIFAHKLFQLLEEWRVEVSTAVETPSLSSKTTSRSSASSVAPTLSFT